MKHRRRIFGQAVEAQRFQLDLPVKANDRGCDEPEILRNSNRQFKLMSADVGQSEWINSRERASWHRTSGP